MDAAELRRRVESGERSQLVRGLAPLSEKDRKALAPGIREWSSAPHRDLDQTSMAIAIVGCLTGIRQVASGLQWLWLEAGGEPHIVQTLRDRQPAWLTDLPAALLANESSRSAWRLVRACVREGLVEPPDDPEYASAMPIGLMMPSWLRDDTRVYDRLLEDPGLLDRELWRMLTTELTGRVLQNADKMFESPWTPRGQEPKPPRPDRTWRHALLQLTADRRIDRGQLVDTVIGAFLRDWSTADTTWFVSMHDALEPTVDEVRERQSTYLRLLAVELGRAVTLAQNQLARLLDDASLDIDGFLAASDAVLHRPDKGTVIAQLKLLDRLAKKHPARADEVCAVVRIALEHERADVKERVVAVLQAHDSDKAATSPPTVRAPAKPSAQAPAPQQAPNKPSEVRPVESPIELAELFARLIEEASDPIEVERALEGVVRLGSQTPGGMGEALARRCSEVLPNLGRFNGTEIRGDLAFICRVWLAGDRVGTGSTGRITGYSFSGNRMQTTTQPDWTLPTLVSLRTLEIARAVRTGRPVLSLPSTDDGSIRPADLTERLRSIGRTTPFLPLDLGLAALRLPPGQYDAVDLPGAHRAARQLRQHLNALKRYQPDWERTVGASQGKWRFRNDDTRYVAWRDRRSAKGSQTDLVAAVLDRQDPLVLMGNEVEDGEYAARFDQIVMLWPLMLPHHRELLAAHAHPRFNRALTKNRSAIEPVLDGLARRADRTGPVTASALALSLSAKNGTERTRAVDAVIDLSTTGLLDGQELGRQISLLTDDEIVVGQRIAAALSEAARADVRAAHCVADAIEVALPGMTGRRDVHRYVEALAQAATAASRPARLPHEFVTLAQGTAKSALAAACRQVPRA